ncbi:MAG TPA: transglycosylase family protein [Solirubrobacteraceae bacterium]|nr:transglycosylase family protein [Solirubrobacteraceae bacterium]
MNFRRRTIPRSVLAALATLAVGAGLVAGWAGPDISSANTPSLGQLSQQLGAEQAHQQSLASSINNLSGLISQLSGQITLVEGREAAVRADLVRDRAALAAAQAALTREEHLLAVLKARLAWARVLLSRQLVSNYEQASPNLVSVVLESSGFTNLLDKLTYLRDAQQQQQAIITITREARAKADAAAVRLTKLRASDREITLETTQRVLALASMNQLLQSRQGALAQARVAQQNALAASRARGAALAAEISHIQAEQAAAELAAQAENQAPAGGGGSGSGGNGAPSPDGPSYGAGGGWAIPYSVVNCESGGQDLTPNSAGASGYYQIIPSSWAGYDGYSQAYQAPKSVQDQRASQLWNGGAGSSNWVCSGIVGIH